MPALIELHVNDFDAIKSYYVDMGFTVVHEQQPSETDGLLVLKFEDNVLCFRGSNHASGQAQYQQFAANTAGQVSQIVVMVQDIEAYYARVQSFANVVEQLAMQESGQLDFHCADPAGFHVRFTSPFNILG
jgi:predicted enzyme related to lactoylglutathione lyase